MEELRRKLYSRKFVVAAFSILATFVSAWAGEMAWDMALGMAWKVAVAYIGIEGMADLVGRFKTTPPTATVGTGYGSMGNLPTSPSMLAANPLGEREQGSLVQ